MAELTNIVNGKPTPQLPGDLKQDAESVVNL
jgi:hypothetical protein